MYLTDSSFIVLTLSCRVQEKEYADAISILYCGYATDTVPLFQPLLCTNERKKKTQFLSKRRRKPKPRGTKGIRTIGNASKIKASA